MAGAVCFPKLPEKWTATGFALSAGELLIAWTRQDKALHLPERHGGFMTDSDWITERTALAVSAASGDKGLVAVS